MRKLQSLLGAGALTLTLGVPALGSQIDLDTYLGKSFICGSTGDAISGLAYTIGKADEINYFLEHFEMDGETGEWRMGYNSAIVTPSELQGLVTGRGSAALTFTSIALEPIEFGGMTVPASLVAFAPTTDEWHLRGKIARTTSYNHPETGELTTGTSVTDLVCGAPSEL